MEVVANDGTLPFDEIKAEIESFKVIPQDEYEGNIGKVMRSFDYSTLDYSVYLTAYRFLYVASALYRSMPHTEELFDALLDLLKARDAAVRLKLSTEKCEV